MEPAPFRPGGGSILIPGSNATLKMVYDKERTKKNKNLFTKQKVKKQMKPDNKDVHDLNINQNDKLLGSKINPIKSYAPKICEYMKNYEGAIEVTNYGCTPAIFKTSLARYACRSCGFS